MNGFKVFLARKLILICKSLVESSKDLDYIQYQTSKSLFIEKAKGIIGQNVSKGMTRAFFFWMLRMKVSRFWEMVESAHRQMVQEVRSKPSGDEILNLIEMADVKVPGAPLVFAFAIDLKTLDENVFYSYDLIQDIENQSGELRAKSITRFASDFIEKYYQKYVKFLFQLARVASGNLKPMKGQKFGMMVKDLNEMYLPKLGLEGLVLAEAALFRNAAVHNGITYEIDSDQLTFQDNHKHVMTVSCDEFITIVEEMVQQSLILFNLIPYCGIRAIISPELESFMESHGHEQLRRIQLNEILDVITKRYGKASALVGSNVN